MGFRNLFKRKPSQLQIPLSDQRRSQGSVDARKKATIMVAKEQIIERKRLQKTIPAQKVELAKRTTRYENFSRQRENVKVQMEQLSNSILEKSNRLKHLTQATTDMKSSHRIGTTSNQIEQSIAKDPHKVPKINTSIQEISIKKQKIEMKGLKKDIDNLYNQHDGLMRKFQEFNQQTNIERSLLIEAKTNLNTSRTRLTHLSN